MLPAFHRTQVVASAATMIEEASGAADALQPGQRLDLYAWTRELALRIAMRALLGLSSGAGREQQLAAAFSQALSFYGHSFFAQALRGPRTPYATAQHARRALDRLVYDEIADRRAQGIAGDGVLGMLLGATTPDGAPLPLEAVRDQMVTLLFAGHDTTTATIAFMFYELARTPAASMALTAELDDVLGGDPPSAADLDGARLPVLERTMKETLRRYPPAWIGPRRTVRDVTIAGQPIPAGIAVHYCSWATHHLPELWDDPRAFNPDRFLPAAEQTLPKGAFVPFGGGSRMCLGKRFGEFEIRALAAVLLQRFRFEPGPATALKITTTPTLGPADGLWFTLRDRKLTR